MNYYQLNPKQGWKIFPKNIEVVETKYSLFIPLVNDEDWHYMNFTSEVATFEDAVGNSVLLEFLPHEEETEKEEIVNLSVSMKDNNAESFLARTMRDLAFRYELEKF